MVIDLDNALQLIGVSVILLLALVGLIFLTYVFIHISRQSRTDGADGPYDWYPGCDPEKVRK